MVFAYESGSAQPFSHPFKIPGLRHYGTGCDCKRYGQLPSLYADGRGRDGVLRRRMQTAMQKSTPGESFSNARFVRNAVEHAIWRHAVRLFDEANLTRDAAMTLTAQDFRWEGETP